MSKKEAEKKSDLSYYTTFTSQEKELENLFYENIIGEEADTENEKIFVRFKAEPIVIDEDLSTFTLSEFEISDAKGTVIEELSLKEILKKDKVKIDYEKQNSNFHEQSIEFLEFLYDIVLLKDKEYLNLNKGMVIIPNVVLDKGIKFIKNFAKNYTTDISYPLESFIYQKEKSYLLTFKNFSRTTLVGTKYLAVKSSEPENKIMIYNIGTENLKKIKFLIEKTKDREVIKLETEKAALGKIIESLGKISKVVLDNSIKEKIITPRHISIELFIENINGGKIRVTPRFLYDGKKQKEYGEYTVLRDVNSENVLLSDLEEQLLLYGFENIKNVFNLSDNEDLIYKFMTKHIDYLSSQYKIIVKKELQNIQFRKIFPVVDIVLSEKDIRIEFAMEGISKDETENILKSLSLKKRYHKLENGGLLHIDSIEFIELEGMLAGLDATDEEIKKGVIIREKVFLPFVKNTLKNIYDKKISGDSQDKAEQKRPRISSAFKILRTYQRKGVIDLINLKINDLGGILADEYGLGKTLQIIAFLHTCGKDKHNLLIVPSYMIKYWEYEFKKYAPGIRTKLIYGEVETRAKNLERAKSDEILITSYDLFSEDYGKYEYMAFDSVIYDEPHLAADKDKFLQMAKALHGESYFCLTSGFSWKNLMEIHYLFELIRSGYLGTRERFKRKYIDIKPEEKKNKFELFSSLVKPYLIYRKRNRIISDLPNIVTQDLFIDISYDEKYKILYINYLQKLNRLLLSGDEKEKISLKRVHTLITRLGQICSHSGMVTGDFSIKCEKINGLTDILKISKIENKKNVVATQYGKMIDIFKDKYNKKFKSLFITKETNENDRRKIYEEYREARKNITLFVYRPTYEELQELEFDVLIHYDPAWKDIVTGGDLRKRIYAKKITEINMVLKGTMEEKIYNLKKLLKNKLVTDLIYFEGNSHIEYTREKFMELLQL